ncbi:MAG: RNA 3'-terminal phosphate cyclase [Chloroflexi bacterium]|nr:RNA 3'-terminal phosphate cyclase [Chloroflexota bacterium]
MSNQTALIRIDGSYGEGGGQIIRTSVSLAAITGQAVEISQVRAGRSRPGLQPQHLTAVRAAARLCSAVLEGDAIGSTRIAFRPTHPPHPGQYRFDIGTAGAGPLVLQTVAVPLSMADAPSSVVVTGGTHVPHAPAAEYLEAAYLPTLRDCGIATEFRESAAGFYPRGGGELTLEIQPWNRRAAVDLTERGKLRRIHAYVVTSQLPDHVGVRGQDSIERLMKAISRPVTVERRDLPSNGPGAAVVIAVECDGGRAAFTAIGARGKPMEKVAEEACRPFLPWWKSGASLDEHLADQIVLPLALSPGPSRWTTPVVTEHLRTVLWAAGHFVPLEFTLTPLESGCTLVELQPG